MPRITRKKQIVAEIASNAGVSVRQASLALDSLVDLAFSGKQKEEILDMTLLSPEMLGCGSNRELLRRKKGASGHSSRKN